MAIMRNTKNIFQIIISINILINRVSEQLAMPGRFSGGRRSFRRRMRPIIDSNKNQVSLLIAGTGGTQQNLVLVNTVDSATLAAAADVERGCQVRAIYLEFWANPRIASSDAVNNVFDAYLFINPGTNLTPPVPGTVGTSNEKKYSLKTWKGLLSPKSTGGMPYYFRGWIKIPKGYQRMGANDLIELINLSATDWNICVSCIYKWYKQSTITTLVHSYCPKEKSRNMILFNKSIPQTFKKDTLNTSLLDLKILNQNILYISRVIDKMAITLNELTTDKRLQHQVDEYFEKDETSPQTDLDEQTAEQI